MMFNFKEYPMNKSILLGILFASSAAWSAPKLWPEKVQCEGRETYYDLTTNDQTKVIQHRIVSKLVNLNRKEGVKVGDASAALELSFPETRSSIQFYVSFS